MQRPLRTDCQGCHDVQFTIYIYICIYVFICISKERAQSLTDFDSGSKDRNGKGTEGGREALLSFTKQ